MLPGVVGLLGCKEKTKHLSSFGQKVAEKVHVVNFKVNLYSKKVSVG